MRGRYFKSVQSISPFTILGILSIGIMPDFWVTDALSESPNKDSVCSWDIQNPGNLKLLYIDSSCPSLSIYATSQRSVFVNGIVFNTFEVICVSFFSVFRLDTFCCISRSKVEPKSSPAWAFFSASARESWYFFNIYSCSGMDGKGISKLPINSKPDSFFIPFALIPETILIKVSERNTRSKYSGTIFVVFIIKVW